MDFSLKESDNVVISCLCILYDSDSERQTIITVNIYINCGAASPVKGSFLSVLKPSVRENSHNSQPTISIPPRTDKCVSFLTPKATTQSD